MNEDTNAKRNPTYCNGSITQGNIVAIWRLFPQSLRFFLISTLLLAACSAFNNEYTFFLLCDIFINSEDKYQHVFIIHQ